MFAAILSCNRGYEAHQNRCNRGYEAHQNRCNRGYEAHQNRCNRRSCIIIGAASFYLGRYNMQEWKIIDTDYLDYLRTEYDSRIPKTDYGEGRFKPFFGELFRVGNLVYLTQVSSPKQRHQAMRDTMDFVKLFNNNGKQLLAVVNLNYMFPAPIEIVSKLEYRNINQYISFSNPNKYSKYINLLKNEMAAIQRIDIKKKAEKLRNLKIQHPEHIVSKRCVDFSALEKAAQEWIKNNT